MTEMRGAQTIVAKKPKGRDCFRGRGVNWRITKGVRLRASQNFLGRDGREVLSLAVPR
jgi:hypothetical protein